MNKKPAENEAYYFNSEGLLVFTRQYHLNRGYCCGNGCLHCPYAYEAVPEPRRSWLLQQQAEQNNRTENNTAGSSPA